MPRIFPSQARELIEQLYPDVKSGRAGMQIQRFDTAQLGSILRSVEEIPGELITLSGLPYSQFPVRVRNDSLQSKHMAT
jgi:hypothetical protein